VRAYYKKAMGKLSTGNLDLDMYVGGGYEPGIISTIYGASGTGKTNLVLLSAVRCAEKGGTVVIVDTEGGIAVERINQLSSINVLNNFHFYQPLDWNDQLQCIEKLTILLKKKKVDLIIIDSIAMLYRLAMGDSDNVYKTNRDMAKQIGQLVKLSREYNIPILVTNQVYANFDDGGVKIVGGDLLKYTSKSLFFLDRKERVHSLKIQKHRFKEEEDSFIFSIKNEGIIALNNLLGC